MGNQRARRLTLFLPEGQPSRRKKGGMPMYVTYSDLIQIGIFIVALIGLCYTIFGRKK
ncbi:putative holin-like toxin [Blautia wexlerae]|uniref:putative holin-like toxin n=1 Tax=Blautia wexlerae TaxID=418240 RepID=UPI002E8DFAFE|nr:putative holin-like toxin [Blautia wexlerae]